MDIALIAFFVGLFLIGAAAGYVWGRWDGATKGWH